MLEEIFNENPDIRADDRSDERMWPLDFALSLLGILVFYTVASRLDKHDPRFLYNPLTYAFAVPVGIVGISILLRFVATRFIRRSMQLGFLISVLVHLVLLIWAVNKMILAPLLSAPSTETQVTQTHQRKTVPDHLFSPINRSSQQPDWARPVEVETTSREMQPEDRPLPPPENRRPQELNFARETPDLELPTTAPPPARATHEVSRPTPENTPFARSKSIPSEPLRAALPEVTVPAFKTPTAPSSLPTNARRDSASRSSPSLESPPLSRPPQPPPMIRDTASADTGTPFGQSAVDIISPAVPQPPRPNRSRPSVAAAVIPTPSLRSPKLTEINDAVASSNREFPKIAAPSPRPPRLDAEPLRETAERLLPNLNPLRLPAQTRLAPAAPGSEIVTEGKIAAEQPSNDPGLSSVGVGTQTIPRNLASLDGVPEINRSLEFPAVTGQQATTTSSPAKARTNVGAGRPRSIPDSEIAGAIPSARPQSPSGNGAAKPSGIRNPLRGEGPPASVAGAPDRLRRETPELGGENAARQGNRRERTTTASRSLPSAPPSNLAIPPELDLPPELVPSLLGTPPLPPVPERFAFDLPMAGKAPELARVEVIPPAIPKRFRGGGEPPLRIEVSGLRPFERRTMRTDGGAAPSPSGRIGPETEKAIELGLIYLAERQNPNGGWSLQGHGEEVILQSDTAATGLCLLAFQGAGYTHKAHQYAETVSRGLQFLVSTQRSSGDLYRPEDAASNRNAWLYSHAIATLALCEAYGMTGDPELRNPAERALEFIATSQDPRQGGWRYQPRTSSDTSVTGWMMMALKSGELAGLRISNNTYSGIQRWMDLSQASAENNWEYRYNPLAPDTPTQRHGRNPTTTMTAVGLLARLYLGWERGRSEMQRGADRLAEELPAIGSVQNNQRDTYYWYYATQVMFHMGGKHWQAWEDQLNPLLTTSQIQAGPNAGSWDPLLPIPDRWAPHAGRIYVTTMNLLSLEVHYRHLPIYIETAK